VILVKGIGKLKCFSKNTKGSTYSNSHFGECTVWILATSSV